MLFRLFTRHWLASSIVHVLRGAVVLVLVLGVSPVSYGELGDPLSTALKSRSEQTGERFILTRKALSKEKEIGARVLLDSQSRSIVIRGWTIIYLPEESVSAIENRAEQNQRVWNPVLAGRSLSKLPSVPKIAGEDVVTVNAVFSHICSTNLEFNLTQPVYVFFYDAKGIPTTDLCHDYMLVLAANDIVVAREGGRLIASLAKK